MKTDTLKKVVALGIGWGTWALMSTIGLIIVAGDELRVLVWIMSSMFAAIVAIGTASVILDDWRDGNGD